MKRITFLVLSLLFGLGVMNAQPTGYKYEAL